MKFDGYKISSWYDEKWAIDINVCLDKSRYCYEIVVGKIGGSINFCGMIFSIRDGRLDADNVIVGHFNSRTKEKVLYYSDKIQAIHAGQEYWEVACKVALPLLNGKVVTRPHQISLVSWEDGIIISLSDVHEDHALRQDLQNFRDIIGKNDMMYYDLYNGPTTCI